MQGIKKVVIIGPESTGKSTLCQQLADHFNTVWCEEYARAYLLEHGTNYTYGDLLAVAKGQLREEEHCTEKLQERIEANSKQLPILFIDTNMYVMQVWCEFVFGKCHEFILEQIQQRKYDLYLLCNTDLPWVKDELREYPDLATRDTLYGIYRELMKSQEVRWINISGTDDERRNIAISAIKTLLSAPIRLT